MATFYANPNEENELWIETAALESPRFRIWHYIFFCFSAFTILVVLFCCCVKIRVPRTKQEIEADYCRKKLAEKFRERLKLIKNQDMDNMDLERALQIIQDDYKDEKMRINSTVGTGSLHHPSGNIAEPQQPFRKLSTLVTTSKTGRKH
ncbi:transmembrane inner ear expressed protein isoform X1 [Diabrotica virgifera virgifera]|uniref:Transmembrane inner ear expressed protein n=2 Tax=Diabrotica virgifera virgifera TaxID=50390 RepID=A0A6P7FQY3_DIAVI|nr:transmembrane inner ear expressed protein isoform X1 [Diabrotica virgifera virgifera]